MTDIGIYASREKMLEIAEQIRSTFANLPAGTHVDTTVYAFNNNSDKGEVIITFGNDDSEPEDDGYQGNGVVVDIDIDEGW